MLSLFRMVGACDPASSVGLDDQVRCRGGLSDVSWEHMLACQVVLRRLKFGIQGILHAKCH
jgi:hypothetical protein